jgi:hypothetical protein
MEAGKLVLDNISALLLANMVSLCGNNVFFHMHHRLKTVDT